MVTAPKFIYYVSADFVRYGGVFRSHILSAVIVSLAVGLIYMLIETGSAIPDVESLGMALGKAFFFLPTAMAAFLIMFAAKFQVSKFIFLNYHLDRSKVRLTSKVDALRL